MGAAGVRDGEEAMFDAGFTGHVENDILQANRHVYYIHYVFGEQVSLRRNKPLPSWRLRCELTVHFNPNCSNGNWRR